jgi:23S rRNA pseudouridine1911/1915/1917 synthase
MKFYFSILFLLFILIIIVSIIIFYRKTNIFNGDIKILYSDDYIIVIDKPVSVAVHDSPEWNGPTINDTLKYNGHKLSKGIEQNKDGIVHRLDVGTSGIIVLAKNEYSYHNLKNQFKNNNVKKTYHAIIQGIPNHPNGTINLPTGLINEKDNIYGIINNGKPSVTHYKTLKTFQGLPFINNASLIEINLETGRTHQIRIHFSYLGHPLIGDTKYGSNKIYDYLIGMKHQWLHGIRYEFDHPFTGERMFFKSEYPENLKKSLYLLSN